MCDRCKRKRERATKANPSLTLLLKPSPQVVDVSKEKQADADFFNGGCRGRSTLPPSLTHSLTHTVLPEGPPPSDPFP